MTFVTPVLTASEEKILPSFLFYHVLTPELICRLFYKPGSLTFAYTILATLAAKQFLQVIKYHASFVGRSQYVYTLARRGLNWLAAEGYAIPRRYHARELERLSRQHLAHTLAVNAVFLSLELLQRDNPDVAVAQRLHDRTLKRQATHVEVRLNGQRKAVTAAVILDGWADVRIPSGTPGRVRRFCFGPEVECSVKEKDRWREKVAAIIAWSRDGYQKQFGTSALTVPVFATLGAQHRDHLLSLTAQTLETLGEEQEADLFRFSSIPPTADPAAIWYSRQWFRPFDTQPVSLLPAGRQRS